MQKQQLVKPWQWLLRLLGFLPMLFIVLIPIIAYILVHEYNTFPEKLSKKVPTQIVSDLRQNFDTMNQQIVRNIMSELSKQIAAQQRNKRLLSPSKANSSKKTIVMAISILVSLLTIILVYIWLFWAKNISDNFEQRNDTEKQYLELAQVLQGRDNR